MLNAKDQLDTLMEVALKFEASKKSDKVKEVERKNKEEKERKAKEEEERKKNEEKRNSQLINV